MSKPRILIIENSIAITGALKSIVSVAGALQSAFSFTFVIPKHSKGRTLLEQNNVEEILQWRMIEIQKSFYSLILYVPNLILNAILLKRTAKRMKIDLIHVNDIYNLIPPLARLFGCKTPYICHIRFLPKVFPKALFNFWFNVHLRFASKIIVVSKAVYDELPHHNKVETVYDGFYFEEKEYFDDKEQEPNSFTFLYLANIIDGKGQNFALRAFSRVYDQLPNWKLRFVGGNMGLKKNQEYLDDLKQLAQSLGVHDKIEWVGFTYHVEKEYRHADIALNFSIAESFSMTSLEALAYECPLIVTNCGGPLEIVENGVTGLLVENENVASMADAMVKLASSQSLRKEMASRGIEFAKSKFDLKSTSAKLKEIYQACIQRV